MCFLGLNSVCMGREEVGGVSVFALFFRNSLDTEMFHFSFLHQELDHNTFCSLVSIPFLSQEGNSSGSAFGWDYRALYLVAFSCDQVTWSVFPMPGWILPQTALPISKIKTMREKNILEVSP